MSLVSKLLRLSVNRDYLVIANYECKQINLIKWQEQILMNC